MESTTEEFAEEYFKKLPAGFRFRPTDEVLVIHYLKNKVLNQPMPIHLIKTCNIYTSHPRQLFSGDNLLRVKERYFFTTRDKKYQNGRRPNRKAGDGFWKATGSVVPIKSEGEVVGSKTALVYNEGNSNGEHVKTNWLMQEYMLDPSIVPVSEALEDDNNNILDKCVLAKIYHRSTGPGKRKASPIPEQLPVAGEAQNELISKPEESLVKDEGRLEIREFSTTQNEMSTYFEQELNAFQFPAPPPQETINPMAYNGDNNNNNVMNFQYCCSYNQPPFSFQGGEDNGFWNSQDGGMEDYCYNDALTDTCSMTIYQDIDEEILDDQNLAANFATQAEIDEQNISRVFFPK